MQKTSQCFPGPAHLGAPHGGRAANHGRQRRLPHQDAVQSIIHYFSVFGNYLNLY
ncbi:MAG: hypothetical protein WBQ36_10680 [Desulfobaccales bacterium]